MISDQRSCSFTNWCRPASRASAWFSRSRAPSVAAEEDAARAYIAKADYEVLAGAIPERAAYREAHNRGQAVTETKAREHGDPVEQLIEALFDKVHALMLAKTRHAKATRRANERKA